jgi:hypothetical protein
MFSPILSNISFNMNQVFLENEPEANQHQFEDLVNDPCILEEKNLSDFEIRVITDKISNKLIKLVEQQLQEKG